MRKQCEYLSARAGANLRRRDAEVAHHGFLDSQRVDVDPGMRFAAAAPWLLGRRLFLFRAVAAGHQGETRN